MTNLCKEYDKFLSENDERFKKLSKENQFYINAIGYGVKYYDLQQRIDKGIHFLNTEYNTYSSSEEWRKALIKILNGEDKE